MTTSDSSGVAAMSPRARKSSSNPSESAWFTRQPNVITEYFNVLAQCLSADITPELHAVEMNLLDSGIRVRNRIGEISAAGYYRQHSPTGGHKLTVTHRGSRMQDADSGTLRAIDSRDRLAGLRRLRIAARRHNDTNEFLMRQPAPVLPGLAARRCHQQRQQWLINERKNDLRFGI